MIPPLALVFYGYLIDYYLSVYNNPAQILSPSVSIPYALLQSGELTSSMMDSAGIKVDPPNPNNLNSITRIFCKTFQRLKYNHVKNTLRRVFGLVMK